MIMSAKYRVVVGEAFSGKTHFIFTELLDRADRDPEGKYTLIVPDQATSRTEQQLIRMNLEQHGKPGFMNIDVLGFNRFSYKVFREASFDPGELTDDYLRTMLVRLAAGNVRDTLAVYRSSIDREGFIQKAKIAISEFLQYQIPPEMVLKMGEEAAADPGLGILGQKLRDIGLIYREFMQYTSRAFLPEDRLPEAAEILEREKKNAGVFYFDAFRSFTPDQLILLKALQGCASELTFTLTGDRTAFSGEKTSPGDLFRQSTDTLEKLSRLFGEKPEMVFTDGGADPRPEALQFMTRHIFRFPVVAYQGKNMTSPDFPLTVSAMDTPEDEIRCVAADIRSRVRAGARYRSFAVLCGDLAETENWAGEILQAYGIPVFTDESRPFTANPFTVALLLALEAVDLDFRPDAVIRFLKSGAATVDADCTAELENHVLRTGIRGRRLWSEKIVPFYRNGKTTAVEERRAERAETARAAVMKLLSPLTRVGTRGTAAGYISALREMTGPEMMDYDTLIPAASEKLAAAGRQEDGAAMATLTEKLKKILRQTEETLGEISISLHDFREMLEMGFSGLEIGVIPPVLDAVVLGKIDRTRLTDVDTVYVIRALSGVLPRKAEEKGLLTDADKERLKGILRKTDPEKYLEPSAAEQAEYDAFYLYQALSRAGKMVRISYPLADRAGSPVERSFLVGRILRVFPGLPVRQEKPVPFSGTPESDRFYPLLCLQNAVEAQMSGNTEQYERNIRGAALFARFTGKNPAHEQAMHYSNAPERLPVYVTDLIRPDVSVSKLEEYAACPYQFFMQYILKIRERREKDLNQADVGSMLHRALEIGVHEILQADREREENVWQDVTPEKLTEIADRAFAEARDEADTDREADGLTTETLREMQRLTEQAMAIIRRHVAAGEMRPALLEYGFSDSFQVDAEEGISLTVPVKGKADRIDIAMEGDTIYVRMIDYKTGKKEFDPRKVRQGTELQLFVYGWIVMGELARKYPGKKIVPAGLYYCRVSDPVISSADAVTDEKARSAFIQKTRLSGVTNDDPEKPESEERHALLELQERGILSAGKEGLGKGKVIPVDAPGRNDQGQEYSAGTAAVSGEEIRKLTDFCINKMKSITENILSGRIDKHPTAFDDLEYLPCRYCAYRSVCRMDDRSGTPEEIPKLKGSVNQAIRDMIETAEGEENHD